MTGVLWGVVAGALAVALIGVLRDLCQRIDEHVQCWEELHKEDRP